MKQVGAGKRLRQLVKSERLQVFDTATLPRDEHGQHWLALFLDGLQRIVAGFHGDRNRLQQEYLLESGLFASLSFGGCVDRLDGVYTFGVTAGVPLRLRAANLLLASESFGLSEVASKSLL